MTTRELPLPTSFALTVRGYDRDQVDEHLADLHEDLRLTTLDRDAALTQAETLARQLEAARAENDELRARLDHLVRTPAHPAAVSDRVRRLLELAHVEADTIVAAARERADAVLRQARAAEQRVASRLRAIDTYLAHAERHLREEPAPRADHLAAA
ncbi:DivIVA domain-containing protein [Amycolatopsis sp. cg9]|uniref:DivIVA domain-containing protein n=1 Tax=Amycolatopsis sp. cg9 TaxID=3238801 RepID=UPI0035255CF5